MGEVPTRNRPIVSRPTPSSCIYCGKTLPLLVRLRGENSFCSAVHRLLFLREIDRLAANGLQEPQGPAQPVAERVIPPPTRPDPKMADQRPLPLPAPNASTGRSFGGGSIRPMQWRLSASVVPSRLGLSDVEPCWSGLESLNPPGLSMELFRIRRRPIGLLVKPGFAFPPSRSVSALGVREVPTSAGSITAGTDPERPRAEIHISPRFSAILPEFSETAIQPLGAYDSEEVQEHNPTASQMPAFIGETVNFQAELASRSTRRRLQFRRADLSVHGVFIPKLRFAPLRHRVTAGGMPANASRGATLIQFPETRDRQDPNRKIALMGSR